MIMFALAVMLAVIIIVLIFRVLLVFGLVIVNTLESVLEHVQVVHLPLVNLAREPTELPPLEAGLDSEVT